MTPSVLIKWFILFEIFPCFLTIAPRICTVRFSDGVVRGVIKQTTNGRDVEAFLGIPYAEPPINELRFKSPVPKKPWDGVLVANRTGIMCPQVLASLIGEEDCLFINVYKPRGVKNRLLPVIAWFHGGAFLYGDPDIETLGPGYLLDRDVVLVTMNYRLDVLGFLGTGDQESPGNYGLKDQALALKWINRNIAAFGGDPNQVTLAGESAGAACVHFHTLSDKSAGLFHKIIMQSGSALNPWSIKNATSYPNIAKRLANATDCPTTPSSAMVECFRSLSVERLLNKTEKIFTTVELLTTNMWGPTKEPPSPDAFFTEYPADLLAKNKMSKVPSLNGVVQHDGLIIVLISILFDDFHDLLMNKCRETLTTILESYIAPTNNVELVDRVIEFYFKGGCSKDKNVLREQLRDFLSDAFFIYPHIRTLNYEARLNKPFYYYNFEYRGTFSETSRMIGNNTNLGATHADDLIYLFPRDPSFFGFPDLTMSRNDIKIMNIMVDLWTSFATDGVPKSNRLTPPNLWKPYPPEENYLLIGRGGDPTVTLKTKSHEQRMRFWQRYAAETH